MDHGLYPARGQGAVTEVSSRQGNISSLISRLAFAAPMGQLGSVLALLLAQVRGEREADRKKGLLSRTH